MPPRPHNLRATRAANRAAAGVSAETTTQRIVEFYKSQGSRHRLDVNRTLSQIQLVYRAEAARELSPALEDSLLHFVLSVVERAEQIHRSVYGGKAHGDKPEETLAILEAAIEQEARSDRIQAQLKTSETVTVVAEAVYNRTAEVLEHDIRPSMLSEVKDRSRQVIPLIAGVFETTKNKLRGLVEKAVVAGKGFRDIITHIKNSAKDIVKQREQVATRTEAVRATNIGVGSAMRHSWQVSHVSVEGCTVIEENGPLYNGIPTCNIKNVPVRDEMSLEFHPNHQGFFAVAGFVGADGSFPKLITHRG